MFDKNKVNPRNIFISAQNKYLFNCDQCKHEFSLAITDITRKIRPQWCSYCAGKKLCDKGNCNYCYNKSFASHEKSQFLCEKNNLNPRLMFKGSNKKYYFKCETCNKEFLMALYSVTSKNDPRWCPFCKKKTEKKLLEWLKNNFNNHEIIYQVKWDWCRNLDTNWKFSYDFLLKELNLIIELDGLQHFTEVKHWNPLEITRKRDVYKMEMANVHGYSVIRIF